MGLKADDTLTFSFEELLAYLRSKTRVFMDVDAGNAYRFENQSISLDFFVCCKSQRYAPVLNFRAVKMHHAHRTLANTDGANQNEQNAKPDAFQNHL